MLAFLYYWVCHISWEYNGKVIHIASVKLDRRGVDYDRCMLCC